MIEKRTTFTLRCDGCGSLLTQPDHEPVEASVKASILQQAENSEWRSIKGRWYCPECYGVDEDDNYVPLTALMCFPVNPILHRHD